MPGSKVLLTTNCTHALEMTGLLLNIGPGDEVIVPSFTFVSTVNAFVLRGATPVFADVREDTFNLDERQLPSLITPKTKAIVVVHYAGVACEMDSILATAHHHNIPVLEDNAHGLFGKYKGKALGTLGAMATQSFHETKNICSGEGGALVINDEQYADRAEHIREKGTNRSSFLRGEVNKYGWVDVGSSWLPSEIVAAYLYGQLEQWETIQNKRKDIWDFYAQELGDWAATNGVKFLTVPEHCEQAYHMFLLLFPDHASREKLRLHLKQLLILACSHYEPLHSSPMGQRFGYNLEDCPVAQSISQRILRLPFHNSLGGAERTKVVQAILQFKGA
eukprot:NODE_2075_length_1286_cov_40.468507_g1974_i0.p1 GENE.NODE_2075_length_1286_cov_40.468507_g1974_i0~~NODE_2075_length_1286_cov_40.468507_g1974_i0.p1  ORF type:complete len:334 (+),score=83.76 NODE_2075_length_1286_cov_40.468507_g1974_i0:188-1189(+)